MNGNKTPGGATEVVAALIWEKDRFMICRRPLYKARGGLWEFVGGKIEPGETAEQALRRECREELDVEIAVDDVYFDVVHVYPDLTVHLTLFNAAVAAGTPRLLEHSDLRWITPAQIPDYDFCPADEEILQKLTREARIAEMEARMRRARRALDAQAVTDGVRADIAALEAYYDSPDWRADYAADEAGLIPPTLPRGVLSEDGLWNLLDEYHEGGFDICRESFGS